MTSMPIIEMKFGIFCILTFVEWNIVMDDLNMDKITLSKWQELQHCKCIMPKLF